MIAVRFHGRGGQGAVIASKLLASAFFHEGWQVQAFPSFGAERTGAPVAAFLRIDRQRITDHYQVYEPDHVIVLDPVLLKSVDVTAGLRPGGWIVVNSPSAPDALSLPGGFNLATCDATNIALGHGLGSRTMPIVNTAIAGAFAAATSLVSLASIVEMIPEVVPIAPAANQAAARDAFNRIRVVRVGETMARAEGVV
jgi:pyruvate ferredoxin oxidoreductase gamma subunit/2-oxoisovalerate ferredoxin oxidoreductase gamma subunit